MFTDLPIKRKLLFLIFLVSPLCLKGNPSNDLKNIFFEEKIHSLKKGFLFSQKIWMKDKVLRFQRKEEQWNAVMLVIDNKIYYYFLNRHVGNVIPYQKRKKNPFQIEPSQLRSSQALYEYLNRVKAKKIGTAMIDGKNCTIFRFRVDKESSINTLWIGPQDFPLKSQCKMPQDIITIYYTNIKINPEMDDQLFIVPKDVHFQEIAEPLF